MTGSVQVGLAEVYEGLRLFVTKDKLEDRNIPVAFTRDTEQAKGGEKLQTVGARLEQMQLV